MARLNSLFTAFLTIAASTQKLGINLILRGNSGDIRVDWWFEILEL